MSDKPKQVNRIPYESLAEGDAVSSWTLPSVDKKSRLVMSAKREQEKNKGKQGTEVVEDYKGTVKPKPLTADDLKKLTEEAKKEGFEQGYQEGLEKGTREGTVAGEKAGHAKAYSESKQKLNDEIQRLGHVASNLLIPMQEQEEALENIIVDMAINFTKELLQQEITQQPTLLLRVVKNALSALPAGSKNITVYVNETDSQLIDAHLPQAQRDWSIQVDNSVTTGGCRVETHESLVDYTCEHRLQTFLTQVQDHGDVSEDAVEPVEAFERSVDTPATTPGTTPAATQESLTDHEPSVADASETDASAVSTEEESSEQRPLSDASTGEDERTQNIKPPSDDHVE